MLIQLTKDHTMNTTFDNKALLTTDELNDLLDISLIESSYLALSDIIDLDAFDGHDILIAHLDYILEWEREYAEFAGHKFDAATLLEETFGNTDMTIYDVVYATHKLNYGEAVELIQSAKL